VVLSSYFISLQYFEVLSFTVTPRWF